MTYRVTLLPQAKLDLERIRIFLQPESVSAADAAVEIVRNFILSLEEMPGRGRLASQNGGRELVVPFGRYAYLIRYRIVADLVVVTRIRHSKERR